MGSRPSLVVGEGEGGGSVGGGLDPEAPWRPAPLFFRMSRSLVFLLSSDISSSSMGSLSTCAMMSLGEWAAKCLSNSSSESRRWIMALPAPPHPPRSEIGQSRPQEIDVRKLVHPLEQLLLGESVKNAIQLVEDFSEPESQAQRRLCGLIWGHWLYRLGRVLVCS